MVRNKLKKLSLKFQVLLSILTCDEVSHLNNMGFWALNDHFFIRNGSKIRTSVDFILIIGAITQNFYRFFSYFNFGVTAR